MSKKIVLILMVLILSVTALTAMAKERPEKIVIAHRGACGYLPEHTLQSYSMAYAMGADYIEPDVVLTKDGVFICVHDIYIEDVTNVAEVFPKKQRKDGHWYAIDFTLKEIKSLKVHERTNADGTSVFPGRFPQGKSNFQIATFAEMIELIQGLNKSMGRNVGICPEFKSPSFYAKQGVEVEGKLVKILAKYGYKDKNSRIYVQCFDPDGLKRLRNKYKSKLRLLQLIGEPDWEYKNEVAYIKDLNKENLSEIAKYADVLSPEKSRIEKKPEIVQIAHDLGLEVIPYTFRADSLPKKYTAFEDELEKFYLIYGVDGLFTDFADKAVNYLKKQGLK